MIENSTGKALPTTQGEKETKKSFILEYAKNRPASAIEIANKLHTTPGYIYKVLSQARKPSKNIRGRNGRIFAHGKVFYEWMIMRDTIAMINAPIMNDKTGMMQIGFIKDGHPCSCQIHSNGHIIVWPHYAGWREWLECEFKNFGCRREIARFIVENLRLGVSVIEGGVKPLDPSFLPNELSYEAEWGAVIVRDNTPEKGVLEVKLSVPDMQRFLGLPDIRKRLEVIEQGSVTLNQSYKAIVALLVSLERQWRTQNYFPNGRKEDEPC